MATTPDSGKPDSGPGVLGDRERFVLALIALALAALLLWLRGGLHPQAPLERLARQSLDLPIALSDGRPTLVEFYADWCEACRTMAPAMEKLEQQQHGRLDVVLLNVDNPRWQPEVERFGVNGIPHLVLFASSGEPVGQAIGAQGAPALQAIGEALVAGAPLPELVGVGPSSALGSTTPVSMAAPRSHG